MADSYSKFTKAIRSINTIICSPHNANSISLLCYNNARETTEYGFNYKNVSDVCTGKKKSHKGFVFKFEKPSISWTYETCKAEAAKYEKRSQFKAGAPGAYTKSKKNGWLDEFFPKNSRK